MKSCKPAFFAVAKQNANDFSPAVGTS